MTILKFEVLKARATKSQAQYSRVGIPPREWGAWELVARAFRTYLQLIV